MPNLMFCPKEPWVNGSRPDMMGLIFDQREYEVSLWCRICWSNANLLAIIHLIIMSLILAIFFSRSEFCEDFVSETVGFQH